LASSAFWGVDYEGLRGALLAAWNGQDLSARLAIWTIAAAGSAVVVLMGIILVLHWRAGWRMERADKLRGRWLSILLDPATKSRLVVGRGDLETFALVWAQLVESIRGDYRESLVAKVRDAGIPRLLRELARNGNLRQKLLYVHVLGSLKDVESRALLAEYALLEDPFLSMQAAAALLEIDPRQSLEMLLPHFVDREDWPLSRVHAALMELDVALVSEQLVSHILQALPDAPLRAVKLMGCVRQESRTMILRMLFNFQQEIPWETEAALLEQIQDPSLADFARERLTHPVWQVVVAACKALGRAGSEQDVAVLSGLLEHPQWWVRYRVARAIAGFPQVRPIEVEMLAARQTDPYARDMLRFALAEQSLS